LELPPQVADVDVERIRFGAEVVAPHLVEDHVAAEHLALIREQQLEQLVLGAGELDLAAAAAAGHRVAVDDQIAEPQLAAALAGRSPRTTPPRTAGSSSTRRTFTTSSLGRPA